MTWLGVGNVEGRVLSGDPSATRPKGSLALRSGIPGHELPSVRAATLDVRPGDVLVLATDGIEAAFGDSLDISGLDAGDHRPDPGRPLEGPRTTPWSWRSATSARGRERGRAAPGVAFRAAYASALADYLRDPSERSLRVAYELGREAVSRQLSVLDLAVAHQEALLVALAERPGSTETQQVTRAAGDFFLESLSSFEMVQRGFREAQEAARLERRQTEMSRQLSTLPGRRLARPRRLRLARGDAAAGRRAGTRARGRRVLRGDGGSGRPAADRGSRLLLRGRQALDGVRAVARPVRDLPAHPPERRLGEDRRRASSLPCLHSAPQPAIDRSRAGSPHL